MALFGAWGLAGLGRAIPPSTWSLAFDGGDGDADADRDEAGALPRKLFVDSFSMLTVASGRYCGSGGMAKVDEVRLPELEFLRRVMSVGKTQKELLIASDNGKRDPPPLPHGQTMAQDTMQ